MQPPDLSVRTVIWAADFSPAARTAGAYASLFADHYGASLIAAHAFSLDQAASEVEALKHAWSAQREELQQALAAAAREAAPASGRAAPVLAEGSPEELIRRLSDEYGPSLIVLGTHGGAVERHLVGSVAEGVLRNVPAPALTVGPHVGAPSSRTLQLRRILYATDFSPAAARAACRAVALARACGAELDILHVESAEALGAREALLEKERAFFADLDCVMPGHGQQPHHSRTFVEFGGVRDRVIGHARERGADLIVLGVHHHSRLAMHFRTGPAFQIIVEASCPVLTTLAA